MERKKKKKMASRLCDGWCRSNAQRRASSNENDPPETRYSTVAIIEIADENKINSEKSGNIKKFIF